MFFFDSSILRLRDSKEKELANMNGISSGGELLVANTIELNIIYLSYCYSVILLPCFFMYMVFTKNSVLIFGIDVTLRTCIIVQSPKSSFDMSRLLICNVCVVNTNLPRVLTTCIKFSLHSFIKQI